MDTPTVENHVELKSEYAPMAIHSMSDFTRVLTSRYTNAVLTSCVMKSWVPTDTTSAAPSTFTSHTQHESTGENKRRNRGEVGHMQWKTKEKKTRDARELYMYTTTRTRARLVALKRHQTLQHVPHHQVDNQHKEHAAVRESLE